MKKTVLILFTMLCMMSTFATVSGNHTVFNEDVGFDSVGVYSDVTVSYSNYHTFLIFKTNSDSVWKTGPSTSWAGSGFLYNVIHNLVPNTTYQFKLVFWKVGQPNDTLPSSFAVTTKPAPPIPVFTVVAIPGLDTSILEMWVTNAIGYYPAISARYGPGLASKTDTIQNKTGNFIARFKLYTPTPNAIINYYIKYDVDTSFPVRDTFFTGSFITPSVSQGHITATLVENVSTDSVQLAASITKGSYNGILKFLVQDSTTRVYVHVSTDLSIIADGTFPYAVRNLSDDRAYYAVFVYTDQLSSDTIRILFRTNAKPKLAAPNIQVLTPGPVVDCGQTVFTGVHITTVPGDTAKGVLTRSNDYGLTYTDTVWTRNNITGFYSTGNLTLSSPISSHHYYWAFDWYSKDNLKNRVILDATTANGDSPNVLANFVGMNTQAPSISFGGYGGCDATIAYLYVLNNFGDTVFRAIVDVGPFQYNKTLVLPNLPNGTYRLIVRVVNQNGSGLDEDTQTRNLVTSITEQNTQKLIYDPYLKVTVYDEVGQKLGFGIWGDMRNWLVISSQIKYIIIYAEKDNKQYSVRQSWSHQY